MKRFVLMLVLLAFAATPALTLAHEKSAKELKDSKGQRVYCCWGKGKCDKQHTKDECDKEGGKVVKDCKECK
jgi:hypothetical protein